MKCEKKLKTDLDQLPGRQGLSGDVRSQGCCQYLDQFLCCVQLCDGVQKSVQLEEGRYILVRGKFVVAFYFHSENNILKSSFILFISEA